MLHSFCFPFIWYFGEVVKTHNWAKIIKESGLRYDDIVAKVKLVDPKFNKAILSYIAQGEVRPTTDQQDALFDALGVVYIPRDTDVCKMTFRVPWELRMAFNRMLEHENKTQNAWLIEQMENYVAMKGARR